MFESQFDEKFSPGTWKLFFQGSKKVLTSHFTCPKCEYTLALKSYKILDDGTVKPKVTCPLPDCDFSDDVTLIDWDPEAWEPEDGSF